MAKYKIWDKQEPIYTIGSPKDGLFAGKLVWTAEEYINYVAPWANNPNVKVIVANGAINGKVFMEFNDTVNFYINLGADITDEMTDEQILQAIEYFEDHPPSPEPSAEERIAAAMEFQNLMLI